MDSVSVQRENLAFCIRNVLCLEPDANVLVVHNESSLNFHFIVLELVRLLDSLEDRPIVHKSSERIEVTWNDGKEGTISFFDRTDADNLYILEGTHVFFDTNLPPRVKEMLAIPFALNWYKVFSFEGKKDELFDVQIIDAPVIPHTFSTFLEPKLEQEYSDDEDVKLIERDDPRFKAKYEQFQQKVQDVHKVSERLSLLHLVGQALQVENECDSTSVDAGRLSREVSTTHE